MSKSVGTLTSRAFPDFVADRLGRKSVWVMSFVLGTSLGAQVAVPLPITPVPITLQPLFVILAGAMLGPRLGSVSMGLYVTLGMLGAPVFSNGAGGLAWLFGPTGGYLLASPAAAFVAGWIAGNRGKMLRTICGLSGGLLTMYAGGFGWLVVLTGQPFTEAFALGIAPFLVGDVVKVCLAWGIIQTCCSTGFDRL